MPRRIMIKSPLAEVASPKLPPRRILITGAASAHRPSFMHATATKPRTGAASRRVVDPVETTIDDQQSSQRLASELTGRLTWLYFTN
jgi:hypothetical protein